EFLEHQHAVGHPQSDTTVAVGYPQRENAGRGQLGPQLAIDRTRELLRGTYPFHPRPAGQQLADAIPQRLLVGRQLEVHARSLGSPSTRSARMFRWICDVPAAMVSEIACSASRTCSP